MSNPDEQWVQINFHDSLGHSWWMLLSHEDAETLGNDLLTASRWRPEWGKAAWLSITGGPEFWDNLRDCAAAAKEGTHAVIYGGGVGSVKEAEIICVPSDRDGSGFALLFTPGEDEDLFSTDAWQDWCVSA